MSKDPQKKTFTCIVCPNGCAISVSRAENGELIVDGHECKRGLTYATDEYTAPKRILATTVRIEGSFIPLLPVRTRNPVPKENLNEILDILARIKMQAPVRCGDTVVPDVLGTGVDVIATRTLGTGACKAIACETR